MTFKTTCFAAAVACAAIPAALVSPASAADCEVMHLLEMTGGAGEARISLNDAYVEKLDGLGGMTMSPFRSWLADGRNTVTIEYLGDDKATFELQWGCKGAFAEEKPLEQIVLNGPGVTEVAFTQDAPVEETYLQAEEVSDEA